MESVLTEGAIERIMIGDQVQTPVVQVLGIKKMSGSGGNGVDRYRMLLSDGVYSHSSAMLATQLNELVERNDIQHLCILRLDKYMCNIIQGDRRVLIILEVTVLHSAEEVGAKIGEPKTYKPGTANGASGPPAASNNAKESDASGPGAGAPQPASNRNFYNNQPAANRQPQAPSRQPPAPSRQPPAPSRQPPIHSKKPLATPGTPSTPGGTPARVHTISSLTPYQNRWMIRGRVTQKQNIRTYNNAKGGGKLFNMIVTDESGDIKVTAFNEEVDKFYEMIEVNKIYYIAKGSLKTANRQYNSTSSEYELTLGRDTTITPCEEDVDLPTVSFNFVPINQLDQHQPNTNIDVIGVVSKVDEIKTVIGKASQKEIKKREVHLVDDSKVQVRMTIWGQDAETFEAEGNPVMAVKGAKLSDFGGRSLSALSSSQILMNPNISEAHQLRGWYDTVGHRESYEEFRSEGGAQAAPGGANWKSFAQVKVDTVDMGMDKAEYFTTKGTIIFMKKDNCMYMACPSSDCNKKVVDQSNGMYRCEKCQKEYPNFKYRMILQMNLADHTDNQWATGFQDTAETILGRTADEMGNLKEQDEANFDQVFQEATFKSYIFKFRSKMESYNDEQRLKTVCMQANPINWLDYSDHLIKSIDKLLAE